MIKNVSMSVVRGTNLLFLQFIVNPVDGPQVPEGSVEMQFMSLVWLYLKVHGETIARCVGVGL